MSEKVKLWRDNRLANEWEAEVSDLVQRFIDSKFNAGDYVQGWPPARRMAVWMEYDAFSVDDALIRLHGSSAVYLKTNLAQYRAVAEDD
jgi:hypothetical protein